MTSFSIRNFGCRVNQAEAFAWAEEFRKHGLAVGDAWEQSDYVLVNSCTLTGRADRDVKRFIHKVARRNPKARLIVTGCLAERAGGELSRNARRLDGRRQCGKGRSGGEAHRINGSA